MSERIEAAARLVAKEIRAKAQRDGKRKMSVEDVRYDKTCEVSRRWLDFFVYPPDAIRAAGLYPVYPNDIDLILSLWEFYMKRGEIPWAADARSGVLPYDAKTYQKRLGSRWRDVLVTAKIIEPDCKSYRSYKHPPKVATAMPPEIEKLFLGRRDVASYDLLTPSL